MASALQQLVVAIQQSNYSTLIILTAVGYDYILTLADEIEYIWNKPWSWVSTLFVLARYFGLCFVITIAISLSYPAPRWRKYLWLISYVSTFILGNRSFSNSCSVILILNQWANTIFIAAADLVMILRVWALYSRSKFILAALLPLYATEVIAFLIFSIVFSEARHYPQAAVAQVLNYSYCAPNYNPVTFAEFLNVVQMALSLLMCLFVGIRYAKESTQMFRVTKSFRLSSYMKILAEQSVLYFLSILAFSLINFVIVLGIWVNIVWILVQYIPAFTLIPRFTLSLRKTYAHERGGSVSGSPAFGPKSTSRGTDPSTVLFADSFGSNEQSSRSHGEMMMEALDTRTTPDV